MIRKKQVFTATLPVVLIGTGCKLCPALRYRWSDEQRFCSETGEVLPQYGLQRGQDCPLREIREREDGAFGRGEDSSGLRQPLPLRGKAWNDTEENDNE